MHVKSYFLLLILGFVSALSAQSPLTSETDNQEIPAFLPEEVKGRLLSLESVIKPQFNSIVESYIRRYVTRNRERTEKTLGRTVMYFPLFEKVLKENGVPDELKYLSVVESALVPTALSRAGAVGLWQFMPETGKYYGLDIDEHVDERRDPVKSTAAAAKYLQRQYERYEDWALAIAAYNSGPGRVNRAIKMARSKNFWRISKYLPRETRNYVPAYIAAAYLLNNYHHHNLRPQYPSLDFQLTESTMVYGSFSFITISQVTGLALEIIRELNPSYLRDFIPEHIEGNIVTLPVRVMTAFRDFLNLQNPDPTKSALLLNDDNPEGEGDEIQPSLLYYLSLYTVQQGDELSDLAKAFGCSEHCLMAWNDLTTDDVEEGAELRIFRPREYKRFFQPREKLRIPEGIPTPSLKEIEISQSEDLHENKKNPPPAEASEYIYYILQKGESLLDIAKKFPGNSVQDLIRINNFGSGKQLGKGTRVKVKKF